MRLSFLARPTLLLALGAATLAPLLGGCGGAPAEPVASYAPFEATDKSFTGDGPAGWDKDAGDLGGTIGKVTFTQGNATIRLVSDSASSFMGDAMKTSNGPPPIVALHERGLAKLEELYSSPETQPAKDMPSAVGAARYSEFTADGGKTHGYRCTMMGPQRVVYATTSCPESDWATLKPAFSKVIGSLKAGGGP